MLNIDLKLLGQLCFVSRYESNRMKSKYSQRCHSSVLQIAPSVIQNILLLKGLKTKNVQNVWLTWRHVQEFSTGHKTCATTYYPSPEQVKFLTLYLQGRCARVLPAYGIAVVGPYYLVDSIAFHWQRLFWWHHSQFFELEFDIRINTRFKIKNNAQYRSLIKKTGTLAKYLMVKFYVIWKRKPFC